LIGGIEAASNLHAAWQLACLAAGSGESHRFGDAVIPATVARLLARGSVSQLYVAESEKAGALVVLRSRRHGATSRAGPVIRTFPAGM
jgi:hypothetical protein